MEFKEFLIQILVGAYRAGIKLSVQAIASPRHIYRPSLLIFYVNTTISELRKSENCVFSNCVRIRHTCQMFRRECRNWRIHQSMSIFRRTHFRWKDVLQFACFSLWHMGDRNASGCAFTPQSQPDSFRNRSTAITSRGGRLVPERPDPVEQVWTRAPGCVPESFRSQPGVNTA